MVLNHNDVNIELKFAHPADLVCSNWSVKSETLRNFMFQIDERKI